MRHNSKQQLNLHQLSLIRDMAIDEIGAIQMYNKELLQSTNAQITALIMEIRSDEYKHLNTFLDILRKYDTVQGEMYLEVQANLPQITNYENDYVSNDYNSVKSLLDNLGGELQAINDYQKNVVQIPIKEVQQRVIEIINDEKEHVERLSKTLNGNI